MWLIENKSSFFPSFSVCAFYLCLKRYAICIRCTWHGMAGRVIKKIPTNSCSVSGITASVLKMFLLFLFMIVYIYINIIKHVPSYFSFFTCSLFQENAINKICLKVVYIFIYILRFVYTCYKFFPIMLWVT